MTLIDEIMKNKEVVKEEPTEEKKIMVHKYMLCINVYPSGKVYPEMFPIGQTRKKMAGKSRKKQTKQATEEQEEVY